MIKVILKWAFRLFLLAVVLVVIAVLSLDPLLRRVMEHSIRTQTGMDVRIGRVSLGLIRPCMEIRDLRLFNPPAYGGALFLDIPEFAVEYDPVALRRSLLHLTVVRFNLGELDIVKNAAGQTNIFALGVGLPPPPAKASPGAPPPNPPALAEFKKQTGLAFQSVDALTVSIGTLKFIDLGNPRNNRTQKIGIENFVVRHIQGPGDLLGLTVLIGLRSGDFFTSLIAPTDGTKSANLLNLVF